jgi:hypothetical protein
LSPPTPKKKSRRSKKSPVIEPSQRREKSESESDQSPFVNSKLTKDSGGLFGKSSSKSSTSKSSFEEEKSPHKANRESQINCEHKNRNKSSKISSPASSSYEGKNPKYSSTAKKETSTEALVTKKPPGQAAHVLNKVLFIVPKPTSNLKRNAYINNMAEDDDIDYSPEKSILSKKAQNSPSASEADSSDTGASSSDKSPVRQKSVAQKKDKKPKGSKIVAKPSQDSAPSAKSSATTSGRGRKLGSKNRPKTTSVTTPKISPEKSTQDTTSATSTASTRSRIAAKLVTIKPVTTTKSTKKASTQEVPTQKTTSKHTKTEKNSHTQIESEKIDNKPKKAKKSPKCTSESSRELNKAASKRRTAQNLLPLPETQESMSESDM